MWSSLFCILMDGHLGTTRIQYIRVPLRVLTFGIRCNEAVCNPSMINSWTSIRDYQELI